MILDPTRWPCIRDPYAGDLPRFRCRCGNRVDVTPTWRRVFGYASWIEEYCSAECAAKGPALIDQKDRTGQVWTDRGETVLIVGPAVHGKLGEFYHPVTYIDGEDNWQPDDVPKTWGESEGRPWEKQPDIECLNAEEGR